MVESGDDAGMGDAPVYRDPEHRAALDAEIARSFEAFLREAGLPDPPSEEVLERAAVSVVRWRWADGTETQIHVPRPLRELRDGAAPRLRDEPPDDLARTVAYGFNQQDEVIGVRGTSVDGYLDHDSWLIDGIWWVWFLDREGERTLYHCWWVKLNDEGKTESYHRRAFMGASMDEAYRYDDQGRLVEMSYNGDDTLSVTYDPDGEVAKTMWDDGTVDYKRPSGKPKRTLRKALRTRFAQALIRAAQAHEGSPLWAIHVVPEGEVGTMVAFITEAERDEWLAEPAEDRAVEWLWNPAARGDEDDPRPADWMDFEDIHDPNPEEFEELWKETAETWDDDGDEDPDKALVRLLRKAGKDAVSELKASPTVTKDFFIVVCDDEDEFPEAVQAAVGKRRAKKLGAAGMLEDGEEYTREHFGELVEDDE